MSKESLVIEFSDWTQRTGSLFRQLDESPDLAARFIENPDELLAEHLGLERAARTVSPENRLLFEILRDPKPLAVPGDAPESAESASGGPATYGELLRAVLARTKTLPFFSAVQPGFNAAASLDAELAISAELATQVETELRAQLGLRLQLEAELRAQLEARLETELRLQLEARLETELRLQLETELRAQLEARLETELRLQLETELRAQLEARLETELRLQLEARLETELRLQLEARLETELRLQLETELRAQLEVELRAQLAAGLEVGLEGPGGPGGPAIARAAAHFSRFDLQRLSGFLASQYASGVTRLVRGDGSAKRAAS